MGTTAPDTDVTIEELSVEEGKAFFDEQARRRLGISGDEFIRAWYAEELDDEMPAVRRLAILLPFANGSVSGNGRS